MSQATMVDQQILSNDVQFMLTARQDEAGYYQLFEMLIRDDLRYIHDQIEVYGQEFPGDTFRVLKEREIK
jgi:hypothetical protein